MRQHFSCRKSPCFLSEERDYQHSFPSSLKSDLLGISFINKTGGSPLLCFVPMSGTNPFKAGKNWGFLGGFAHVMIPVHVAIISANVWETL